MKLEELLEVALISKKNNPNLLSVSERFVDETCLYGNELDKYKDIIKECDEFAKCDSLDILTMPLVKGKNGEIYNVGSSEQISIKNLAERIAEVFENKLGVKILGDKSPDPVSSVYVPNIEKAKKDLGLANFFSLNESLLKMRHFLQNNKSNSISTTI